MSLTLAAASLASSQARALSAPRGTGTAASTCLSCPTPFVAALPRCSLSCAPALQTHPERLHGQELLQRRQQRAALLRCAAEASSSSSGDARQQQQEPAATAALVLSSSDDERVPPDAASSSSSDDAGAAASSAASGGSEGGSESSASDDGAVRIDLQLPRRSLLVQFTCNVCGGRSERLCNPIAWQKGLVIAQCQHCPSWHKLADAANLVEEIRYADLEDE